MPIDCSTYAEGLFREKSRRKELTNKAVAVHVLLIPDNKPQALAIVRITGRSHLAACDN